MVIWWLGVPAMAFVAWQAFRRRSLALALIADRVRRASGSPGRGSTGPRSSTTTTRACRSCSWRSAYFVAELWHGAVAPDVAARPRRRRRSRSMGPVILWLLRCPLCAVAGVERSTRARRPAHGNPGNLVVTPATAAMVVVALVTVLVLLSAAARASAGRASDGRPLGRARPAAARRRPRAVGGVALAIARLLPDGEPLFTINGVGAELIALIVGRARSADLAAQVAHGARRPPVRRRAGRGGRRAGSCSCTRTSRRCRCRRRSSTRTRASCRPTSTRSSSRSTPRPRPGRCSPTRRSWSLALAGRRVRRRGLQRVGLAPGAGRAAEERGDAGRRQPGSAERGDGSRARPARRTPAGGRRLARPRRAATAGPRRVKSGGQRARPPRAAGSRSRSSRRPWR